MTEIAIQVGAPGLGNLPAGEALRGWAESALRAAGAEEAGLLIRLVNEAEITDLNRRFRRREGSTNVLSFPFEAPPGLDDPGMQHYLGDVVICAPVVEREAREQGKAPEAHWAHMVIHGILHLCGHDHHEQRKAEEMEGLEREILAAQGFPDPYRAEV